MAFWVRNGLALGFAFLGFSIQARAKTLADQILQRGRANLLEFVQRHSYSDQTINFNDRSLSAAKIHNIVQENEIHSIDELLKYFHDHDINLLKGPGLSFISRSRHHATLSHPRVILSDPSGRLLMAYSGDPKDPNYDKWEMLEYDLDDYTNKTFEADFSNQNFHWSENPLDCAGCHSTHPLNPHYVRALMDEYNSWPRFFFGVEPHGNQNFGLMDGFRAIADRSPRYRYLELPEKYHPNDSLATLATKIMIWNADRIAATMLRHPDFFQMKNAFWAALHSQDPHLSLSLKNDQIMEGIFGKGSVLLKEFESRYEILEKEYFEAFARNLKFHKEMAYPLYQTEGSSFKLSDWSYPDDLKQLAVLGTIFSFMGIDLRDYSTDTMRNYPGFKSGLYPLTRFLRFYIPGPTGEYSNDDPTSRIAFGSISELPAEVQPSRNFYSHFQPAPMFEKNELTGPELLKSDCSSCHSEKNPYRAPGYAFGDLKKFREELSPDLFDKIMERVKIEDPSKRMPYAYPPLSPDEIQTLQTYLRSQIQRQ